MELRVLDAIAARSVEWMTFPAYRHLLALGTDSENGCDSLVQPAGRPPVRCLALGAIVRSDIVGLALSACFADEVDRPAQLVSLFVSPALRNRGIGTRLVGAMESELRARGHHTVEAVYMTGSPSTEALEAVLANRHWQPPVTRSVTVRFTPAEAMTAPWFDRVRLRSGGGDELVPWIEVSAEEREEIRRSHERSQWITKGLEPWRHDANFEPVSSLALRCGATIGGWTINHRLSPDVVRFTCSFMRKDLARRGCAFALYTESLRRLAREGCRSCTLVTPLEYAEMARFLSRRCRQAVHFFGETRGSRKALDDRPMDLPNDCVRSNYRIVTIADQQSIRS